MVWVWCGVACAYACAYAYAFSSHDSVSSVNHPISNQKSSTGSFLPLFLLVGFAFPFTLFHFLLISFSKLLFKHTILSSPTHSLTHSLTVSCLSTLNIGATTSLPLSGTCLPFITFLLLSSLFFCSLLLTHHFF